EESDWEPYYPSSTILTFSDYLKLEKKTDSQIHIINLCRNFKYLSNGYYTSLLAEARGHKVIPSLKAINDLSDKSLFLLHTSSLDEVLDKKQSQVEEGGFSLLICFGQVIDPKFAELAMKIFELFPFPILRVQFDKKETQRIRSIKPIPLNDLVAEEEDLFASSLENFNKRLWRKTKTKKKYRYDLAILVNPEEKLPPSNNKAIKKFISAAKYYDILAEPIYRKDLPRLAEYDALFIRATTSTNHFTYTFSRKAESEGLVVLDDPTSILRCTNKVFLHEALMASKVSTPKTYFMHAKLRQEEEVIENLGFPIVLKIPDGSFSKGVFLAKDETELKKVCHDLFRKSELIIAQEFMYTPYDWRVGILNKKAIYVCQYFMSKDHWQIYDHKGNKTKYGESTGIGVHKAPKKIVRAAINATSKIGDGIYGVDIKEKDGLPYIIEVNDNPNIDAGVEDAFLGEDLYSRIMEEFSRRLQFQGN
ncbi:MAG: RimK family protein, partial [Bdellovibrionales bacterium]|nr:RimK family protein [Bdellovibrionales bacterium]